MSIQSEINRIAGAKSDIADAIEDKGVTVPSGTKLDGMANLIGQISGGSEKLNSTQAADAYDPTATYAVGDKVSYAGNVYSCISAISTPEAWDSTHWDQVDPIQAQVDDVRNTLNSKADQSDLTSLDLTGTTNTTGSKIDEGTYFYLNGSLVKALTDIASGATFTNGTNYEEVTAGGLNDLINLSKTENFTNQLSILATGYISSIANCRCYKFGKMVCFNLACNISAMPSGWTDIISGLPEPLENNVSFYGITGDTKFPFAIVKSNGEGRVGKGGSAAINAGYYIGNIVYPAK